MLILAHSNERPREGKPAHVGLHNGIIRNEIVTGEIVVGVLMEA